MWELPQITILQFNLEYVGTTTNHGLYSLILNMWELPQITILQFNLEYVGTTTNHNFTV